VVALGGLQVASGVPGGIGGCRWPGRFAGDPEDLWVAEGVACGPRGCRWPQRVVGSLSSRGGPQGT
jgi:hypothetical protein